MLWHFQKRKNNLNLDSSFQKGNTLLDFFLGNQMDARVWYDFQKVWAHSNKLSIHLVSTHSLESAAF